MAGICTLRVWIRHQAVMDYAVSGQTGARIEAVLREGRTTMPCVYFSTTDGRDIVLHLASVQAVSIGLCRSPTDEERHSPLGNGDGEHRSLVRIALACRVEIMAAACAHPEQILDLFQGLEARSFQDMDYLCLTGNDGSKFFLGLSDLIAMEASSAFLRQAMFPIEHEGRVG